VFETSNLYLCYFFWSESILVDSSWAFRVEMHIVNRFENGKEQGTEIKFLNER
jgi:hypothetical protein